MLQRQCGQLKDHPAYSEFATWGDGGDELVLAVIYVSYAFLQSNPYGGGKVKYTPWKDALTGMMRAFRASGPQYGERSAPTRWLDTLIEFMASIGFESCYNEPSVFIDRKTGVIVAVHVDDATVYGKKIYVVAFLVALKESNNHTRLAIDKH